MLQLILFHVFSQVLNLPPMLSDLAAWLLLPTVMGLIAPALAKAIVSLWPARFKPAADAIRFAVYIAIALASVGLANIPADVLAQLQPVYVAIAAAIMAFVGDHALNSVASFLRGAALFLKQTGYAVFAVGLRLAFGPERAHQSFTAIVPHA